MQPAQKPRVLVVDPDATARGRVRESLALFPVDLDETESMRDTLCASQTGDFDLILSELDLPDASGFVLCRQLRDRGDDAYLPVIILSHWTTEADRILAFECGADDFVAKPYFGRELSSRVEAVLRRGRSRLDSSSATPGPRPGLETGPGVQFKRPTEVRFNGVILELTPKERALLGALASAGGRVLSRPDLISQVWSAGAPPTSRSVDSHIKTLRRKLDLVSSCVETVRGVGYRFAAHPLLELR